MITLLSYKNVVCTFVDDIYMAKNWLENRSSMEIVAESDYVKQPRETGYRSLHLDLCFELHGPPLTAELQLRTLAMDCWATLEHKLKDRHGAEVHPLLARELKR